jgi:hypothetical protein
LPPALPSTVKERSQFRIPMCTLPDGLPALTQGQGNFFPGTPSGTSEGDAFSFGHLEVAPKRAGNSKDFERIGVWVGSNGVPRFPK